MFMRQDRCVLTPQAHLDFSPCATRHVPAKRLLRSHATSTLGSLSVRKQTCSCDNTAAFARCEHTWISLRAQGDMFRRKNCCLLTPGTLGSLSVRKKTCSCHNTAALARCEHTWISLRARKGMFHRKDCCVLTPRAHLDLSPCASKKDIHATDCCACTPQGQLDLSPCANRRVSAKRLLRSHVGSALGSCSVPCAKRHFPSKRLLRARTAPQDR